jgi:hypothetical protein
MRGFRSRFAILGIAATVVMAGLTVFLVLRNVDTGSGTAPDSDPVLTEWWRSTGRDLLGLGREAVAAGVEGVVEMRYCMPGEEFVSNRCDELGGNARGYARDLRDVVADLERSDPPESYSQAWVTAQAQTWSGIADSFDRYAAAADAGYERATVEALLSGGHGVDTLPAELAYAEMVVRVTPSAR